MLCSCGFNETLCHWGHYCVQFGFTTAGTMSLTDCPCGHSRTGDMAYRDSSEIGSAGSLMQLQFQMAWHVMEEPSTKGAWASNWKWAKPSILLKRADINSSNYSVYRDNAKWPPLAPRSAQPCFIFLRWDAWPSIPTRAALFTMTTVIMAMYGPMQCQSCIQGMKIRIRSSRMLESFAGWGKETPSKNCRGLGAVWRLFAPHLRDPSNHRNYSLA